MRPHTDNPRRQAAPSSNVLPLLTAVAISVGFSVFLTLWAHLFICAGFAPESIYIVDWLAPLLGLLCAGAFAGSLAHPGWKSGGAVSVVHIAIWFLTWSYLESRLQSGLWWREAVLGLTWRHGISWVAALLAGTVGGLIGERLRATPIHSLAGAIVISLALLPAGMGVAERLNDADGLPHPMGDGITVESMPPDPDGTQARLLTFDFTREPDLGLGIYDADSDDARPFDNRNSTWLGMGIELLLDHLQHRLADRGREVRCLINGGFFDADDPYIATHEAPLVVDGHPLYDIANLQEQWPEQAWLFGVDEVGGRPRFHLEHDMSFARLNRFHTALGGVRPLRVDGQNVSLKPGMGNLRLRCSRTSIAWDGDSRRLYILSVRDPDGETASLHQLHGGEAQTGGWDLRQVQQFWTQRQVPEAVLFDGGESTQIAYGSRMTGYRTARSAYQVSHTFGYWRERPLRCYLPMLPAAQNSGGVLNYLYIDGPRS